MIWWNETILSGNKCYWNLFLWNINLKDILLHSIHFQLDKKLLPKSNGSFKEKKWVQTAQSDEKL